MSVDASTAWAGRNRVLFGRMHEDPAIEMRAFGARSRVFAIASAGCTARALASAGYRVTAVDVNPAQLAYARRRSGGGPVVEGAAEHLATIGRRCLPAAGWSKARLCEFLALDDVAAQRAYWRDVLDTARWHMAADIAFSRMVMACFYNFGLDSLPRRFGPCLRRRLARCSAMHANRPNPYLRGLLLGEPPANAPAPMQPIEWVCADAAEWLERCPAASFDAFTLSNIGDGTSPEYRRRLWAAVERAATPVAMVVMRSFGEPHSPDQERWAASDRNGIWGRLTVTVVGRSAYAWQ